MPSLVSEQRDSVWALPAVPCGSLVHGSVRSSGPPLGRWRARQRRSGAVPCCAPSIKCMMGFSYHKLMLRDDGPGELIR
jgi:hypothetical protein